MFVNDITNKDKMNHDEAIASDVPPRTVVQKSPESECMYWATRSSIGLFAHTAHAFACSALLVSLARSAVFICSLARSLTHSQACGKDVSKQVGFVPQRISSTKISKLSYPFAESLFSALLSSVLGPSSLASISGPKTNRKPAVFLAVYPAF